MLKRAAWISWSELLDRVNHVIPYCLPPAQELALQSDVLPKVRLQRIRKREAWIKMVWESGMPSQLFEDLWKAIRPPRRVVYDWTTGI